MNQPSAPTPEEAHWSLVEAAAAREMLAARGRWPQRYLAVYAFGAAITFIAVGLGGAVGIGIVAVAWPITVIVMQRSSRTRAVTVFGGRRAIAIGTIAWAALYICGLLLGYFAFRGDPWYWIPASLVVALPFILLLVRRKKS